VRFHHTLPFMTKQRFKFRCGYLQTAQEVTESLILNAATTAGLALLVNHANSIVLRDIYAVSVIHE